MAQPIWVGIDISGKWLDVGSYPQRETIRFPYTDAGIAALLAWLAARPVEPRIFSRCSEPGP